jgi:hypothetical protein
MEYWLTEAEEWTRFRLSCNQQQVSSSGTDSAYQVQKLMRGHRTTFHFELAQCRLLARNGHGRAVTACPLLGDERKSGGLRDLALTSPLHGDAKDHRAL